VVVFGDLLSGEECEALIELAKPRLARSLTVATKTGGEEVNADRTSNGMFFQRGENELVKRIEARIARLVNWPEENGEGLQVLHYRPGHGIQAPLTTTSIPSSPVRRRSSSAGGSVSAR
jgi:prolyl 4-hydroxylase